MTPALLFFLLVPVFFAVWAAWIWRVWPRTDPTSDALWERRHQAHFRDQAHKP